MTNLLQQVSNYQTPNSFGWLTSEHRTHSADDANIAFIRLTDNASITFIRRK